MSRASAAESVDASTSIRSKLRPADVVLNQIKWDGRLDETDYEIAYWDRVAQKNLTKPVSLWTPDLSEEEFVPMHRIKFFYRKSDRKIMWDRDRRQDLLFLQKVGTVPESAWIALDGLALKRDSEFEHLDCRPARDAVNHLLFHSDKTQWTNMIVHYDPEDVGDDLEEKSLADWRFINSTKDFKALLRHELEAHRPGDVDLSDNNIDARPDTIAYRRIRFIRTTDDRLVWNRTALISGQDEKPSSCPQAPPSAILQYFRVFQILAGSTHSLYPMRDYTIAYPCPQTGSIKQVSLADWANVETDYAQSRRGPKEISWMALVRISDQKEVWERDGLDLIFGSGSSAEG